MELSILIALLNQSKTLNIVSWVIFMITAMTHAYLGSITLVIIIIMIAFILVMTQSYYALRASLDYDFFQILQKETASEEKLQSFDSVLRKYGIIQHNTIRSLESRALGAINLLKLQLIYLALQSIFYLASLSLWLLI